MKHTRTIVIIAAVVALLTSPLAMTGCEADQDRKQNAQAMLQAAEDAEAQILVLQQEIPRLRELLAIANAEGMNHTAEIFAEILDRAEKELLRTQRFREGSLSAMRLITENAVGEDGSVDAEQLIQAIGVGVSTAFPPAAPFVFIGTVLVGIFGNLIGKKKGKQVGARAQALEAAPIIRSAHEVVTGVERWRHKAEPAVLADFNATVAENTSHAAKRFVQHSKGQIQDIQIARLEYGLPTVQ